MVVSNEHPGLRLTVECVGLERSDGDRFHRPRKSDLSSVEIHIFDNETQCRPFIEGQLLTFHMHGIAVDACDNFSMVGETATYSRPYGHFKPQTNGLLRSVSVRDARRRRAFVTVLNAWSDTPGFNEIVMNIFDHRVLTGVYRPVANKA